VDANHSFIAQMFEKEVNSLLKSIEERHVSKKRTNPSRGLIFNFFSIKDTFKKEDVS
jgi:phage regulator Rha-like protein